MESIMEHMGERKVHPFHMLTSHNALANFQTPANVPPELEGHLDSNLFLYLNFEVGIWMKAADTAGLSRNLQPYVAYRYTMALRAETNIAKKVNWGQGFSQNATEFVSAHDYIHRLQKFQVMQPRKSFESPLNMDWLALFWENSMVIVYVPHMLGSWTNTSVCHNNEAGWFLLP